MRKRMSLIFGLALFVLASIANGCIQASVTTSTAGGGADKESAASGGESAATPSGGSGGGTEPASGGGGGDLAAQAAEMEKTCSDCHGVDQIKSAAYSSLDEWKALVERMKTKGAPVTDVDAVATFLEKSKGFKETGGGGGAAPAGGGEAAAGGASDADKAEVEKTCTDCHGKEQIAAATYSGVDAWKGLVERMKTKGAPVTDVDKVAAVLDATKGLK